MSVKGEANERYTCTYRGVTTTLVGGQLRGLVGTS